MLEALQAVNYLHVLVAVLAYYMIGFMWYGPFSPIGKIWMRETGVTEESAAGRSMAGIMVGTLLLTFLIVTCEAVFLLFAMHDVGAAVQIVVFLGGIVAGTTAMNYLYQNKSITLFFIDFGYQFVGMLVAGIILAAWK